jgi:hypothetical protein
MKVSRRFLLGLFFYPEDGGGMFLRNFGWLSTDYIQEDNTLHKHRCENIKFFITGFSDVRHNIDGHKVKQILF